MKTKAIWESFHADDIRNALLEAGLYRTKGCNEFLATGKGIRFGETERYFFKVVDHHLFKEVRLFKKSGKVTTANKTTGS